MTEDLFMPGRYTGRIVACDSGSVGEKNTPMVKIFFRLDDSGKTIPWTGWFSDKVNQRSGKTYTQLQIEKLIELGFQGKCVSDLSNPKLDVNGLLDTTKLWNLDVDFQEDKNGVKTKYFEIKWINDPDKQGSSKMDHSQSVQVFKGMNLGGLIMQAKKEFGTVKKAEPEQAETPSVDSSDIPF